jgi:cysteine-rich repeat protein
VVFDLRGSSANESGGSGGDFELFAPGTIRLGPGTVVRIDAGTQLDGDAGTVLILADLADEVLAPEEGDVIFEGLVSARGGNGPGTSGSFGIELGASRNVLVAGPIISSGSDYGGDVLVEAGGAVTIAAPVRATATAADGTGGSIQVVAGLATNAPLTIAADIDGAGGRAGGGDAILLAGCAIDVAAGTTIDGRGGTAPDGDLGGTDLELLWHRALTIADDARLLAGPGGTVRLVHAPGSLDAIDPGAVFDPTPIDLPHPGVSDFLPCPPAVCGNGVVEPGETCDDGNDDDDDDCSAACASQCAPVAAAGCRGLVAGGSGRLIVRDETRDGRDVLEWKWTGGAATPLAALGDPITRDAYRLCLYDLAAAEPTLRLSAAAPAGGTCAGRPCWRANRDDGFRYRDRDRTPDGIDRLELRAGAAGTAKMRVTGKGSLLALPPLPLALPALAQLHGRDGECWEARFDGAGTTRNDARRFKARAVLPTPGPTPTGPTPTPTRTATGTRTPTPLATPDLSTLARLELLPRQVTREMGKMVRFTTIGHLADGSLVDLTQQVEYVSSDAGVGVATNQPGDRSRVDTAAAGTAVIAAHHAATGVGTTASGDDAALTVLGALERVTLAPASATIVPDEALALTAAGHYTGGGTLDLTHRVDYRSSAPAVVSALNHAGAKHVVTGVAPGTATISAVDPLTGVATGPGDGDATVEVVPLVRLAVSPAIATVEIFRTRGFTATGHYADGSTRNLTTRVTFVSSEPATASIDANRAAGLAIGSVTIAAHDPITAITSTASGDDATLTVTP